MTAKIQKTDSDGNKSTFTIVGSSRQSMEDQVFELQQFARRNSTYPDSRYEIIDYGDGDFNKSI